MKIGADFITYMMQPSQAGNVQCSGCDVTHVNDGD